MKGRRIYLSQDLCLRRRSRGTDPWYRSGETLVLSATDIGYDRSNGMSPDQRREFLRLGSQIFTLKSEGIGWFRVVSTRR